MGTIRNPLFCFGLLLFLNIPAQLWFLALLDFKRLQIPRDCCATNRKDPVLVCLLSLSLYWFRGNASTMYNKDTAPSDGEQQSRRDGANEEWGRRSRRSGGGALYREGDSRVQGAARPIRWLQLITVCLLIVRRPRAELLRREGGEFDLITAHPKGDLGNV